MGLPFDAMWHTQPLHKVDPAPEEFTAWLQHTFVGAMAGMLLYGVQQSRHNRELGVFAAYNTST